MPPGASSTLPVSFSSAGSKQKRARSPEQPKPCSNQCTKSCAAAVGILLTEQPMPGSAYPVLFGQAGFAGSGYNQKDRAVYDRLRFGLAHPAIKGPGPGLEGHPPLLHCHQVARAALFRCSRVVGAVGQHRAGEALDRVFAAAVAFDLAFPVNQAGVEVRRIEAQAQQAPVDQLEFPGVE